MSVILDPENKALFQCVQDLERHLRRLNSGAEHGLSPEDIWNLFSPLLDQIEDLRDETLDKLIDQNDDPVIWPLETMLAKTVAYIIAQRQAGHSEIYIRAALRQQGMAEVEIDAAFERANK